MNSKLVRVHCIVFCLLAVSVSSADEASISRAATDALNTIKGSGKACPPSWSNAAVDKVERLELASGSWYLAHITGDGKSAGYILIAEREDTLWPVMYSASAAPIKMMAHVSKTIAPAPFNAPPLIDSLAGVPMIAIPKPRSERFTVTPLDCSLAGMCMWFQAQRRVPLFFLLEEITATRPFDMDSPLLLASPQTGPIGELTPFYEQRSKILMDPQNSEPSPPQAGSLPWGAPPPGSVRKIKDRVRLFEQVSPLLQSTLMQDLSRPARRELIQEERGDALSTVFDPWTDGVGSAVVVHSYLTGRTLEQGLERFARSRGIVSPWVFSRPANLARTQLPCVLYGPGDQGVLVTGLSEDGGTTWITITAPETAQPLMRSRLEVENEAIARFRAMNPGQPTVEESMLREHPERKKEFEERKKELEAKASKEMMAFDARSGSPQAPNCGEHVARLDLFVDWQVVSMQARKAGE